jgi:chromosome segregation ATPase
MTAAEAITLRINRLSVRVIKLEQQRKRLNDDNRRVRSSRQSWKEKHRSRERELSALKRKVARLEQSRDMWRERSRDGRVCQAPIGGGVCGAPVFTHVNNKPMCGRHAQLWASHNRIVEQILAIPPRP